MTIKRMPSAATQPGLFDFHTAPAAIIRERPLRERLMADPPPDSPGPCPACQGTSRTPDGLDCVFC